MKSDSHRDERIQQIFQNAIELFVERGYDNTPLSLIAKKCGLTKAGLYYFFDNKEQLLFSIHQQSIENSLIPILDKAARENDPEKRLKMFLCDFIIVVLHDAVHFLLTEAKRLTPEHHQEIAKSWRKVLNLFTGIISELKSQGKVPETLNSTFAAFAVIGMCVWTPFWFDRSRPESIQELVDTIIHIFFGGIQKHEYPTAIG